MVTHLQSMLLFNGHDSLNLFMHQVTSCNSAGMELDFQITAPPGTVLQLQPQQFDGSFSVPYTGMYKMQLVVPSSIWLPFALETSR